MARIVRIKQFYGSPSSILGKYTILLLVKLESVPMGGTFIPLTAVPETVGSFQQSERGALYRRVELGTPGSLEERSAGFEFRTDHLPYLIGSGLESTWITKSSAPGDSVLTPHK